MQKFSTGLPKTLMWIGIGMTVIVIFHLGGSFAHSVGQFSPLVGAFLGGGITLYCASISMRRGEQAEAWTGLEQISWLLIGIGMITWGLGESVWRYYISVGQTPFPSMADAGYTLFPLLAFAGLLLQPAPANRNKRMVLVMDSCISMGSIFAIAWYLLLGSLAQASGEANLAKFLGIYYPTADMALLSCIVFLLLRGQGRLYQANARRISLLVIGLGICFFVTSDFLFNIQNNAGTYVEATWVDLGWPLGMMTIGAAAYIRRFYPKTLHQEPKPTEQSVITMTFSPQQLMPYALLGFLFVVLTLDILSPDTGQRAIRPVLLLATLAVVALLVTRQIFTIWDNQRLSQRQAEALDDLELANARVEEQSRQIAAHNVELEGGIEHLKTVQASLANGNLRTRAHLTHGALLPLAGSLNLMAERLARLGQGNLYAQRLVKALGELSIAFERTALGVPLAIPESCNELPEVHRLLVALRLKGKSPGVQARFSESPLPTPLPKTQTAYGNASRPLQQRTDAQNSMKAANTTAPQGTSTTANEAPTDQDRRTVRESLPRVHEQLFNKKGM